MRMNVHGHRPVLGYFVLASLLIHALLVNFWRSAPSAGPQAETTFQITVLARRGNTSSAPDSGSQPPREARTRPAVPATVGVTPGSGEFTGKHANSTQARTQVRRNAAVPHTRTKSADSRLTAQATGSAATEKPAQAEAAPSATADSSKDGQRMKLLARSGSTRQGQHELSSSARHSRVLAALQEALFPHFNYPPLARRRGWQGQVNVGLRVEADGDLTRIHLVKSSGHALLDRAALRNISELRNLPGAARWLGDDDMDVVLPVLYQLVD